MLTAAWQNIFIIAWVSAAALLAIFYVITVTRYRSNWRKHPEWLPLPGITPSTSVSVVVPARNEAGKIRRCLNSIAQQNYPSSQFEVLVVDDHSEDGTLLLAQYFARNHPNIRVVEQSELQQSKKSAIETGIGLATGELIVCTDADCELPSDWLHLLASFFEEKQAKFIAAPVNFQAEKNRLQRFQSLDFLGMMGVTGAGFHAQSGLLCNGANLAYPRSVFYEVNGFEGIARLASGDDMLLLHKIAAKYPNDVYFLKNRSATALTEASPNFRSFVSQRLRWASKSKHYADRRVTLRLVVVFLLCLAILLNLLVAGWWGWPLAALALGLFLTKAVVDFRFLNELCRYFGRRDLMQGYLLLQGMHIAYILGIGILANVAKRYEWKGRRVH